MNVWRDRVVEFSVGLLALGFLGSIVWSFLMAR
jgi:hypothetical protein